MQSSKKSKIENRKRKVYDVKFKEQIPDALVHYPNFSQRYLSPTLNTVIIAPSFLVPQKILAKNSLYGSFPAKNPRNSRKPSIPEIPSFTKKYLEGHTSTPTNSRKWFRQILKQLCTSMQNELRDQSTKSAHFLAIFQQQPIVLKQSLTDPSPYVSTTGKDAVKFCYRQGAEREEQFSSFIYLSFILR